ncbi:T3SS effector HopA1 family protein [Agreia sp. COWG]|uniref:T3SS effector HopA1 family protein n=1 Tax=Agreia sp. COWG TaxID=2773266 RepID=UPI00192910C1|nr:T3SS effector HopA1 family protein [Agreia sp. COWG]CAD5990929.1 conserved protein of unknown function [Agreia sp. COWG]
MIIIEQQRGLDERIAPGMAWIVNQTTMSGTGDDLRASFQDEEFVAETESELTQKISSYLYRVCHAGLIAEADSEFLPALSEDRDFETQLFHAAHRTDRIETLPVVGSIEGQDGLVIKLQGLRVLFPSERIISVGDETADVLLPSVESRLSLGFMFYTTRRGAGTMSRPLRIYRHISSAAEGLEVWRHLTRWAETENLPLRAKIISAQAAFPRNDALVAYLPSEAWHRIGDLACLLASENPAAARSIYTRPLAPGVGLAWEPFDVQGTRTQISFGEHRSAAVARGIVAGKGNRSATVAAVRSQLLASNIDPMAVYRNLDSPPLEWWVS